MRKRNIVVKLVLMVMCLSMFCSSIVSAETTVLDNAKSKMVFSALTDQPMSGVYNDFELPVNFEGTVVLWESNNPGALSIESENGKLMAKVHPSPFGGGIAFVTLTACMVYNEDFVEKSFVIQVAEDNTGVATAKYLSEFRKSFEKQFLATQNINAVTNDLILPNIESDYVTYSVKSENPNVLSDTGVVIRNMEKDTYTTLDVTFRCYTETLKVIYPITIKAFGDNDVEEMLRTDIEDAISRLKNSQPLYALTNNITLPTNGKYGSAFYWTSNNKSVISDNGTISRGIADESVTLTLHGELAGITDSMSVNVTVLKNENATPFIPSGSGVGSGSGSSVGTISPVTPTAPPTTDKTVFTDLPKTHWAYDNIMSLYEVGVVDGYEDNTIRPSGNVLREEAVKLIMSVLGLTGEGSYGVKYTDVPETAWYYSVVMQASQLGMVNGVTDTEFGAGRNITRQDLAVMFYRIAGFKNTDSTIEFADEAEISDYARKAVSALAAEGIVMGDDEGYFNPKGTATRAEAMTMISRLMQK